jgi:hypothetical protein
MHEISCLADEPLASKEGLASVELVVFWNLIIQFALHRNLFTFTYKTLLVSCQTILLPSVR